jgi:glycosyltransferase involved in cell wall biosynthesis
MDRLTPRASIVTSPRVDVLFGFAYDPDVRVRRISQALAGAGYDVRIFAWDRDQRLPEREHDGRVEVRRVHLASYRGRGWSQLFYLARAVARYVPDILRRPPDILHAVDLPMLLAAILIAPLTGRRPLIVYDAFEIYAIMESHKYPRWVLRAIAVAERLLPRYADLVITPGEGRQRYFAERGIRSVVVPNWIDPAPPGKSHEDARRALEIPPEALTILYAGGLDPSRDLASLVRHARRHPAHTVLVAGNGEQAPSLSEQAATIPNLRLLGWLADPSEPLAAADMLYYSLLPDHPYATFAAPNNLYTAIAYAIPLVHRMQGEVSVLAERHPIGASFNDDGTLDAAIAELAEPGANAHVRHELRRLQRHYRWSKARARLLAAYPKPPRMMISRASVNGE